MPAKTDTATARVPCRPSHASAATGASMRVMRAKFRGPSHEVIARSAAAFHI
jgi:hypothetical protein